MTHPCASHACDHCYLCDVVGICCSTVSSGQRAQLEASDQAQRERLYRAIAQEAVTTPTLTGLVRSDATKPAGLPSAVRLGLLLPAPLDPVFHDSRKEVLHGIPTRST